jgi:DNA-binding CsgD family transcriptional regulator
MNLSTLTPAQDTALVLLNETIEALAESDFYEKLLAFCDELFGFDRAVAIFLNRYNRPIVFYEALKSEVIREVTSEWLEGAYLLDPFYTLFDAHTSEGIYELSDIAPDEFFNSDYYATYYQAVGVETETGILIHLDQDNSFLIVLGRVASGVKDPVTKVINRYCGTIVSLVKRHQSAANGEVTFSAPLDRAFRNFGKDHLSARECEVVQLLLKGHSNKSIANLLSISVDTVKVYNKRFHQKLEVSSQAELFSLFLECISLVPFDADIDPLTHYREISQP